jgi:hypothetical protein
MFLSLLEPELGIGQSALLSGLSWQNNERALSGLAVHG